MSETLGLVEKAMIAIEEDPARALDPALDIFGPVAAQLPEFKAWQP